MRKLYQDILQSSVCLNAKAHKIVFKKFNNCLIDFCKKEGIKIVYYDTIEDLNDEDSLSKCDKNKLAAGMYVRLIDKEQPKKIRITENYPQIKLLKNCEMYDIYYPVYTLAHEIGHHLAIKNFLDRSESTADHFILLLAEEFLTDLERHIISISLRCFSKLKIPEIKIKRKDWINFKKEHNI